MRQDEAERFARKIVDSLPPLPRMTETQMWVAALCDHILSGDRKREIENAAFERVALEFDADEANNDYSARGISKKLRSLIQPPAQKENGECC